MSIPGMDAWLASAPGRYVLDWEQRQLDGIVADIFGFNALQLGLPQGDFLRANRIPLRQHAGEYGQVDVLCNYTALPFASNSIDLVVLPHILEFSDEPHQILREVERILIPEGQVIVIGFNPLSLWGLKRKLDRNGEYPWNGTYLSINRLKDWLKLLGFEVDRGSLGCYVPPVDQLKWLQNWRFIENATNRWWNFSGGVYVLRAIKRTHSMRLITPIWKKQAVRAKALRPIAQKERHDR
ncbi:MAG: ric methyl-transferase [Proteobacteria bacterium]|nr:ric methyl-transferase [Pseudomonadota bacterium]